MALDNDFLVFFSSSYGRRQETSRQYCGQTRHTTNMAIWGNDHVHDTYTVPHFWGLSVNGFPNYAPICPQNFGEAHRLGDESPKHANLQEGPRKVNLELMIFWEFSVNEFWGYGRNFPKMPQNCHAHYYSSVNYSKTVRVSQMVSMEHN